MSAKCINAKCINVNVNVADLSQSVQDRASGSRGLMSQIIASPVVQLGLLHMRLFQVVNQEPEGFTSLPSAPQDHGDVQRLPRSETVEKTSVPPEKSPTGSVPSSQDYNDRRIPYGLGGGPSRMSSAGNLVRETAELAYKSVGTTSSLIAVFLNLKQFLLQLNGCHVLVRTDCMTVVSFLNCQEGLRSRPLYKLVRSVRLWAQTKFLSIRVVHIPGDLLSRQRLEDGEWRLHPQVVNLIWQTFGQTDVDLFASSMTTHCLLWFALSHLSPLSLNALAHEWPRTRLYAFPPVRLLSVILLIIRAERVEHLLLVAPWWPTQTWFSDMVSLLVGPPLEIPLRHDLLTPARGMIWHPQTDLWKLWVWPLSRKCLCVLTYWLKPQIILLILELLL